MTLAALREDMSIHVRSQTTGGQVIRRVNAQHVNALTIVDQRQVGASGLVRLAQLGMHVVALDGRHEIRQVERLRSRLNGFIPDRLARFKQRLIADAEGQTVANGNALLGAHTGRFIKDIVERIAVVRIRFRRTEHRMVVLGDVTNAVAVDIDDQTRRRIMNERQLILALIGRQERAQRASHALHRAANLLTSTMPSPVEPFAQLMNAPAYCG